MFGINQPVLVCLRLQTTCHSCVSAKRKLLMCVKHLEVLLGFFIQWNLSERSYNPLCEREYPPKWYFCLQWNQYSLWDR